MGGEWIRYNVMTERTDILYLQCSRDSTFTRNWSRILEAEGDGTLLATEGSEPSETNSKAARETPALPVTIKENKQPPTAAGTSKRARENTTPGQEVKKQRVETPDKLGTTHSLQKSLCRLEPT